MAVRTKSESSDKRWAALTRSCIPGNQRNEKIMGKRARTREDAAHLIDEFILLLSGEVVLNLLDLRSHNSVGN
jgi:hypothetical protein